MSLIFHPRKKVGFKASYEYKTKWVPKPWIFYVKVFGPHCVEVGFTTLTNQFSQTRCICTFGCFLWSFRLPFTW